MNATLDGIHNDDPRLGPAPHTDCEESGLTCL